MLPQQTVEKAPSASELLLGDIKHFGDSLWQNEQVGEKRFNFFVTLVTAVAGGLVTLVASQHRPSFDHLVGIAEAATAGLLVVGLLTYLRMLRRSAVARAYQKTLKELRDRYVELCPHDLQRYEIPVTPTPSMRFVRGGYAETVGTLNGMILAALVWLQSPWHGVYVPIACGATLAALLWAVAVTKNFKN